MEATFHLAPDVHLARVRGRTVALDLRRGRYIGIAGGLATHLDALLSTRGAGDLAPADRDAALAKLGRMGLLGANASAPSPAAAPALSTLWPTDRRTRGPSAKPGSWMSAISALTEVSLALKALSLRRVVRWMAREHRAAKSAGRDPQRLLDDFVEVRPWFVQRPVCRLDAMALCLHLWRNGAEADLIFGVDLDPFAAHCWVQSGSAVLNEAHDGVRRYTSILVV